MARPPSKAWDDEAFVNMAATYGCDCCGSLLPGKYIERIFDHAYARGRAEAIEEAAGMLEDTARGLVVEGTSEPEHWAGFKDGTECAAANIRALAQRTQEKPERAPDGTCNTTTGFGYNFCTKPLNHDGPHNSEGFKDDQRTDGDGGG